MISRLAVFLVSLLVTLPVTATPQAEIQKLPSRLAKSTGLPQSEIAGWFDRVSYQKKIIDAITRPSEGLPWYRYKKIFLNKRRIDGGVAFWKKHRKDLESAEKQYGVPAEIIVAIIGVETQYGHNKGRWSALDSLATLAVGYPRRSKFFYSELVQLVRLAKEEKLSPVQLKSSYAGALGLPQFMPSSYRAYAVDFNADGQRDLLNSEADAIGSVANYFARHGWKKNAPVVARAKIKSKAGLKLVNKKLKPSMTLAQLAQKGIKPLVNMPQTEKATVLGYDEKTRKNYQLGFKNFYVITRYNTSRNYAMAAWLLAQELKKRMG
ncbi:MAG: lytic murein transglycosylase B [Gammaproteobacteria bacterium]|nr:MAG: lytic murein transglycosylase B [Gammaproteobacteria bacterium]